jgi:hypothetical protein
MIAHPEHFANSVAQRRKGLGLTFVDVNVMGGPTAPTVAKAEAGELADPRPSTLSKFDVGLQWIAGSSARAYWEGEHPRPAERAAKMPVLNSGSGTIELPLGTVLQLMSAQKRLNDIADAATSPTIPVSELIGVVESLNSHLSTIVGHFVTDLLERNYSTVAQQSQPLIEFAFDELLSAPVSRSDPDRIEKLYRRWLLGKPSRISPDLEADFRHRLRRKDARSQAERP